MRHPRTANTRLQTVRFTVQIVVVSFTLAGLNSVVHIFGLPRPAFIALVIIAGMFFCGWGCPFGALQDWLRFLGKRLTQKNLNLPNPWHRYLALSRYLLWAPAFFALWSWEPLNARRAFLALCAGRGVLAIAICLMMALLFLAVFMDRPYCKYLCGFGSEFGLMSLSRVFTLRRSQARCLGCKKCDKSCPMGLEVSRTGNMRSANCINCLRCLEACPVEGALGFGPALVRKQDLVDVKNVWLHPRPHKGKARRQPGIGKPLQQLAERETSA
jgi:polyferredoxin